MLNETTRDHSRGEARHEHAACTLCGGRVRPMLCGPHRSRAETYGKFSIEWETRNDKQYHHLQN